MGKTCPYCSSPLRDTARFCPKCGQKLPQSAVPFIAQQRGSALGQNAICPNCGAPPRGGAKFCARCGSALNLAGPGAPLACPICHRLNRVGAVFCAHCGGVLASKKPHAPFMTGKLPPQFVLHERYRILQKIAQGGMSAVYLAVNERDSSAVYAIKEMSYAPLNTLPPDKRGPVQEQMRGNFLREYEILRDFSHPNLPRAYDFFEESGRPYIVMDFIRGKTLEKLLKDRPQGSFLPESLVLAWARQICDVLDYLHGQTPPVIYRDLKPSNVMQVEDTQDIRLIDFGIARFYKPGKKGDTLSFGTEGYLAPEIFKSTSQTSPCTDIYALGAVLHELLTGLDPCNNPFNFQPVRDINPAVSKRTEEAIERALKMQSEARPQCAREMLKALFGPAADFSPRPAVAPKPQPRWSQPAPPSGAARPPRPPVFTPPGWEPTEAAPSVPPPAAPAAAGIPAGVPTVEPQQAGPPPTPHVDILRVRARRGRKKNTAVLTRAFPALVNVQVIPTATWLYVNPPQFAGTGSPVNLQVEVSAGQLEGDHWRPAAGRGLYQRLPGFLRAWLGVHLQMVPAARVHRGDILLNAQDGTSERVEVEVEVQPSAILVFLGWFAALLFMIIELGLVAIAVWALVEELG